MSRTARKTHHSLSIDELDSSDDSAEEKVLVNEIVKLQKSVQQSQREKKQLDLKIEGLEHDIVCAEKARAIGNNAALSIMKRLGVLFGEALKEEDLAPRIQQLQERARNARQEVESLKSELASLKVSTPRAHKDNQKLMQNIREEIEGAKAEEQRLIARMGDIDEEIEDKQQELKRAQNELETINGRFTRAVSSNTFNVGEIRDRIAKNSDEFLLDQCARVAQTLGIPFDSRGQLSDFINDLKDRIVDLRSYVTPTREGEERFASLSRQVEEAMNEYKDISREVKIMEKEKKQLKSKMETLAPAATEELQSLFGEEKHKHDERTKKLRSTLKKALAEAGYNWEVPKSHAEICAMYRQLLKTIDEEITRLNTTEYPKPDLTVLESKVEAVRRQNSQLRRQIHKL